MNDRRVMEWDGFNFMRNKFFNGLWRTGFWRRFLRRVFGVDFWSGGEEWCVGREMIRIIFGGSVGVGN